jgi:hypothetical protein
VIGAAGTAATSVAGTATSAAATASPVAAAAAPAANGFLHSLFQVLQDNHGSSADTQASATPSAAGQYQGSLVSSLQSLIQQVGSTDSTNPSVANLEASFNNLAQGTSGNDASAASNSNSNAALQSFLNSLLHNLQANGLQAPKMTGSNVDANV